MHYTSSELRAINHDRPPARAVRKSLFTFRLWCPAYYRRQYTVPCTPVSAGLSVNKPGRRPTDTLSSGWSNVQSLTNKTESVSQLIVDESLYILALTKTWHTASDDVWIRLTTLAGYAVVEVARSSGCGGGVAIIHRKQLKCSRISLPFCFAIEALCVRLSSTNGPIIMLNVCRPGSAQQRRLAALFFDELASILEVLVLHSCPVVIGGDFNIHIQVINNPDTRCLCQLMSSFDVIQHVHEPTHRCGGTSDLVMTFAVCEVNAVSVDPTGIISDHLLVICHLPVVLSTSLTAERLVRGWHRVNRGECVVHSRTVNCAAIRLQKQAWTTCSPPMRLFYVISLTSWLNNAPYAVVLEG